jgi:DNA-binding NtrC family response regulator
MPGSNQAPRLLIVDDEPDLLEILDGWFQGCGFDVALAGDSASALVSIEQRAPEVLVTDIRMPGMSGLELLVAARQLCPTLEVIILTGHCSEDDAQKAQQESGAFAVLIKPLKNLTQLQTVVERALSHRRDQLSSPFST